MYTTVNEFYEGYGCYGVQNSDLGNVVVDISNTYTLDGLGNIEIDHYMLVNGIDINPVIQNLHMVELTGCPSLYDFRYELGVSTPFGVLPMYSDPVRDFPASAGFDPTNHDSFRLWDPTPEPGWPHGTAFASNYCTSRLDWYFISRTRCPVIGVSRKSDGCGVLAVHGFLPSGSQPVVASVYAGEEGIIPIITQFAMSGYSNRSTTRWKIYFFPMNGSNNSEQKTRACQLANYYNPISVTPW
jgi:hypothetical protein